jgi:hypothetical protein
MQTIINPEVADEITTIIDELGARDTAEALGLESHCSSDVDRLTIAELVDFGMSEAAAREFITIAAIPGSSLHMIYKICFDALD